MSDSITLSSVAINCPDAGLERLASLSGTFLVAGTGVDPVTSRFSGARSAN